MQKRSLLSAVTNIEHFHPICFSLTTALDNFFTSHANLLSATLIHSSLSLLCSS